jgi:alanyl-tRNA synthetase
MTANELRTKWLEFFKSKGHTIIPSASLVPENDASVLFTMAGMFPLVPYLMGQDHPGGKRVANSQKCIRTIDIDEVGDDTHLTFFEMLGNWSFGDYFKQQQIEWSYEFLTDKQWLGLPLERLAFSVFAGDDDAPRDEESAAAWLGLGISKERLAYLPKANNWWIAGATGPCGPDTEMFYWVDDGTPAPKNFQDTHDDPRWVEIWNDVFMQYEKRADGKLVPLKQQNVDTGMGLERTLTALNGQRSVYDTDLFKGMFDVLALDQEVMTNDEIRKARIIVDHVRAATFMAGDGVIPTNKDRGYIMRRLLRRSLVNARLLNLKGHWLQAMIGKVVAEYTQAYPDLLEKSETIFAVMLGEEKKFSATLEKGLREVEKLMKSGQEITGTDAFNFYQTFGFPKELTRELAEGAGQKFDAKKNKEFDDEFKKHQDLSRTAAAGDFKGGLADHSDKVVRLHTTTHLMQAALRKVLGNDVWQKGSNITAERTRFDFTYPNKMTDEQRAEVEKLVNEWIKRDLSVKREFMPLEKARELGAIGLFGEKYADTVSIYIIYDPDTGEVISREFCGGPHVEHTNQVGGKFRIAKEEAVSAGMRRVKGVVE